MSKGRGGFTKRGGSGELPEALLDTTDKKHSFKIILCTFIEATKKNNLPFKTKPVLHYRILFPLELFLALKNLCLTA